MIDALIQAIKFDEFLIALVGQVANEASAKLTITAVKAIGVTMLGAVAGPLVALPERQQVRPVQRQVRPKKLKQKNLKTTTKSDAQKRSRSRG